MTTDEFADSTGSPEIPDRYRLNGRDRHVVATAIQLLEKVLHAPFTRPAEAVSIAKLLHILKRLPRRSTDAVISVGLRGPERVFGEHEIYHHWSVNIMEDQIEILAGGHFYRESTGGDTFTCVQWNAEPGVEPDYHNHLDELRIVDDVQPFDREVAALDLTQPGYILDLTDEDNPMLEELSLDAEEEVGEEAESTEVEYSAAEQELAALADEEDGRRRGQCYANPSDTCDICGCRLRDRAFFVDGRLRGQVMFGCMCVECFFEKGEGIGWGQGQIYRQEPDGHWLMVAGFPPKERP